MINSRAALVTGASLLGIASFALTSVAAAPRSALVNGKTYYLVNAADTTQNSGNKVCAAVGKKCLGYTAFTNDVCVKFHPTARKLVSVNGSKAGFYCDGAPQKGLACEKMKNTCEVCPACNVNMDCATDLTSMNQFREAYVECGGALQRAKSAASSARSARPRFGASSSKKITNYGPLPLPGGNKPPAGSQITCTFSQKPLKRVTCGVVKAGDTWCAQVMQSTAAKAVQCQETGNVVCAIPCTAPGVQNLKQCAFGGVKSGSCPAAASSSAPSKKRVGVTCAHGGECNTSYCVGVPDYYKGMQYFCSCSQWKYDTSCGK